MPPSLPIATREGFFGSMKMAWWSPCTPRRSIPLNVRPPSLDAMIGIRRVRLDPGEVVAVGVEDLVDPPLVGALPGRASVVGPVYLEPHDVALEELAVGVAHVRHEIRDRDAARLDVLLEPRGLERFRKVVALEEAGDGRVIELRELLG